CPRCARAGARGVKRGELTAARRYARALLEVSFQAAEGDPAALRRELAEAGALLQSQHALAEALGSPAVPLEAKRQVVQDVWRGASALLRRLLEMLVERGRIGLLDTIATTYAQLWNAARGVLPAEATSAVPLSEEQLSAVQRAL